MMPDSATKADRQAKIDLLWRRYKENGDPDIREKLIVFYAPMIRKVVGRMGLRPDGAIEWEDLLNYGVLGLIDAVERFEPERGITFETFASLRVRGAVLDALRQHDPLGRLARRRVRAAKEAIQQLTFELGRVPSDSEVAEVIELNEEQYRQVLQDASFMILSLDQPMRNSDDGQALNLSDVLEDSQATSVLDRVEEEELHERLMHSLKSLTKREQILLSLYYSEELTMREVADVMEISQTRVCQIHARAIMTLKALMAPPKTAAEKAKEAQDAEPSSDRPEPVTDLLEKRLLQPKGKRNGRNRFPHHWSEESIYHQSFDSG
ncbi:MAG: FliA/WhiG family RNA polymerase sigma factor [Caldilineaceae bacterium]|nr:FliA/WhiG family RNA polymerase sigma factor [Caldilineaceae bacterium]